MVFEKSITKSEQLLSTIESRQKHDHFGVCSWQRSPYVSLQMVLDVGISRKKTDFVTVLQRVTVRMFGVVRYAFALRIAFRVHAQVYFNESTNP